MAEVGMMSSPLSGISGISISGHDEPVKGVHGMPQIGTFLRHVDDEGNPFPRVKPACLKDRACGMAVDEMRADRRDSPFSEQGDEAVDERLRDGPVGPSTDIGDHPVVPGPVKRRVADQLAESTGGHDFDRHEGMASISPVEILRRSGQEDPGRRGHLLAPLGKFIVAGSVSDSDIQPRVCLPYPIDHTKGEIPHDTGP